MLLIKLDNLTDPQTRSLLAFHLQGMQADSPAESVFALDLTGLQAPGVFVWSVRYDDDIAGVGALKILADGSGELKSMRTHPDYLRRGVGSALLEHTIDFARTRGCKQVSLETGSGPAFEPALALYRKRGFTNGNAFSDYVASDFNQFLHLNL